MAMAKGPALSNVFGAGDADDMGDAMDTDEEGSDFDALAADLFPDADPVALKELIRAALE